MNKNIVAILIGLLLIGGVYFYTHQEVRVPSLGDEAEEVVVGFKGLIAATDFAERIESGEYIVLDIRTPQEYDEQRIGDDALSIDFYDTDFEEKLEALDKSKKYLIHCRSGGRSSAATKMMEELGFEEFYELEGGINTWNRVGLPTHSGKVKESGLVSTDDDLVVVPTEIKIANEFPEKIVYGDNMNEMNQEALTLDCHERGGAFSVCGSVCSSSAKECTSQCAFTCEFESETPVPPMDPVMCTADAMQCPDGSYVGRTGPNCEFMCPEVEEKKPLSTTEASSLSDWWKPTVGLSWQWQLSGEIDTSYDADVYDVDLFEVSAQTISELHADDRKVLCYFSAGSQEDWRPDADLFPSSVIGNKLDGWEGERWLDFGAYEKFADVMTDRLDLAVEKGCDGVEPDNVDGFTNDTGFEFNANDQLEYNIFLANESHRRGLAIALKNNLDQVPELVSHFDMSVNEQCFEYEECDMLTPFIKAGKPVFGVEYELSRPQFCLEAEELQFSWLEMEYDLDGGRKSCDDVNI